MIREGVEAEHAPSLRYAGFWIRGAAFFLDGILQYSLGIVIGMLCGQSLAEATGFDGSEEFSKLDNVLLGVGISIDLIYATLMVGRFGGTLGKLALGLRVVQADGARIAYGRAFCRSLANYLNFFSCTIGYLIAVFDPQKRALHDRVCNTRVIRLSSQSSKTKKAGATH